MNERQITMHMSQEFMQAAIHHYLDTVMFRESLAVKKVEVEQSNRQINQTDHFRVFIEFPDTRE